MHGVIIIWSSFTGYPFRLLRLPVCHELGTKENFVFYFQVDSNFNYLHNRTGPIMALDKTNIQCNLLFVPLTTRVVAEWLRRWTWNPLGSPRAGSNSADYVLSRNLSHSNNYDRQLLSLAICCTCPVTGSLIVFFNTALCSLGPRYFGYFLVEENPATVVVLLTAFHFYKADNSPVLLVLKVMGRVCTLWRNNLGKFGGKIMHHFYRFWFRKVFSGLKFERNA